MASFLRERAQLERAHRELLASHRPPQERQQERQQELQQERQQGSQDMLSSHRPPSMCGADAALPAFRSSLAGLMDPAARAATRTLARTLTANPYPNPYS